MNWISRISIPLSGLLLAASGYCQESELDLPLAKMHVAMAEMNEVGELVVNFGNNPLQIPVEEEVEQNYTVAVPYQVEEEVDGEKQFVTRTRMETRSRVVTVFRIENRSTAEFQLSELGLFTTGGASVGEVQATDHFGTKQPVIVVENGTEIGPYFDQLLREEVVIVELPQSDIPVVPRAVPGRSLRAPLPRRVPDRR